MITQGSNKQNQKSTQGAAAQGNQTPNSAPFMPNFGLNSRMSAFGSGGEVFEKLFEAFAKRVKVLNDSGSEDRKYDLVKLLKQPAGVNYSGIILVQTAGDLKNPTPATPPSVVAHVLIIEKTGEYPDRLVETIGHVRYEITRTPGDALDDRYITQTQIAVGDFLRVDPNLVNVTDGTLVPNEFDINSDALINELFVNTHNAVNVENAIRVFDYRGTNLAQLMQQFRNGKFFVNLSFNGDEAQVYDQTGLPIRQDICILLSYKANQNGQNRSVNQGNDSFDLVKTYGYIDFEHTNPMYIGNMPSKQRFVPNFIITHIDTMEIAPTPDILMLGVASVLSLNEDQNWMQAFRTTPAKKDTIDFNDIGALNIEGNIENSPTGFGARYNTKVKTFTTHELNNFIQMLVKPQNFVISIDIPKAGPDTWALALFQYIKFRNDQAAFDRLNTYLSTLTNGVYQHNNIAPFFDATNKIHGGFYRTKEGFRDIRHLACYLGVANFIADTNQQPSLIAQYTNTLYSTNMPTELRAAERRNTIDEMSAKTAVYKQYYDRITFNRAFLENFIASLRTIGFSPVFSNMGEKNDMFVRRSTIDFSSASVGGDVRFMNAGNQFGQFYMPQNFTRSFG